MWLGTLHSLSHLLFSSNDKHITTIILIDVEKELLRI